MPRNYLNVFLSKKNLWGIAGIILVAGGFWVLLDLFVCKVPPDVMTRSSMRGTQFRIVRYYSSTHKLPPTLADLPDDPGYNNTTTDAWGREIGYRQSANRVILESMGRDGKPGGNGVDQDIYLVFDPSELEWVPFSASPPTGVDAE